jgi:hypothetical protein
MPMALEQILVLGSQLMEQQSALDVHADPLSAHFPPSPVTVPSPLPSSPASAGESEDPPHPLKAAVVTTVARDMTARTAQVPLIMREPPYMSSRNCPY